jgi:CheY-like chemotaxis protein
VNDLAQLLTAIAAVIGAVVWPALLLVLLLLFRVPLRAFIDNLSEFSLKAGGVEATAKRTAVLAAGIATSEASRPMDEGDSAPAPSRIAAVAAQASDPRNRRRFEGARILWVDDQPRNNAYEVSTLKELGISIDEVLDTDDALNALSNRGYDLVISDMGRPPDNRAGYTLLDQMQTRSIRIPLIIYSFQGSRLDHQAEARSRGAKGSTSSPTDLFELITDILGSKGSRMRV